jgi:hypothetical protein
MGSIMLHVVGTHCENCGESRRLATPPIEQVWQRFNHFMADNLYFAIIG